MRTVVFVQGGGVGLDQEPATRRILDAAGVKIDFRVYSAGRHALDQGQEAVPAELLDAVRSCGVALKTKLLPAKQERGSRSEDRTDASSARSSLLDPRSYPANFNVEFRRRLGL